MAPESRQHQDHPPPSLGAVFRTFLRLGLTAFGGPAMVAIIGETVVERKRWLSREVFQDGVALAQTVPGATAMQTAAYCGLRARGVAGAAAAYIGFGLPAFVLITVLSGVYGITHTLPVSQALFRGLQVIVVAIVARAVVIFGIATVRGWRDVVITLAAAAALLVHFSPLAVIGLAALAGLALRYAAEPAAPAPSVEPLARRSLRPLPGVICVAALALIALRVLDRKLFDLAALMLRVDVLAFGGGFASVPLMLHAVVDVKGWMTTRTFMDGIAMGQVTPGPIVITATFVGYRVAEIVGAVTATLAVFTPSFVVLVAAVPYFESLQHNALVRAAIRGVLASFVGLLLSTAITFGLAAPWSPFLVVLGGAAFAALMLKVDLLWVVLAGGVASVMCRYVSA